MARLELSEVRRLDALLGELMKIEPDVDALISQPWFRRYLRRVGFPLGWSAAYDFTFSEQLSCLLVASGEAGAFAELITNSKSFKPVLDYAQGYEPDDNAPKPKRRRVVVCLLVLKALLRNVACMSYYSKSMSDLLRQGVDGDVLSFKRAVAVDPTLLATPSASAHVAQLHLGSKKRELKEIYLAAVKGPNRQLEPYRRLRYLERVMREGRVFAVHGREAVFGLVVDDLKAYEGRRGDPFKSLFTLFERWNQDATT